MRRATTVIAIVLLSVLGACGGSDEPPADSGSSSSPADAAEDTSADSEPIDACEVLSVDEVGTILGGTVTAEKDPSGGCQFNQEDPRAPSASIYGVVDAGGGFEASKGGNATDGTVEAIEGVGDGAWVAVGRLGGDNLQGQAVVAVGDQLVNVALIQAQGLEEAQVRTMTVDLLGLVASSA